MPYEDSARYDHQGYSREERAKNSRNLYELMDHEKKNINEISRIVRKGKCSCEEYENYLTIIEKLEMKLMNVLATEEKEGLMNTEIQVELGNIRKIKSDLIAVVTRMRRNKAS